MERPLQGEAAFLAALPVATIQGFNPWAIYTVGHHETGGFPLSNPLVKANNFAGVKAWDSWQGPRVKKYTDEHLADRPGYGYEAEFCGWPNAQEFMAYYCGLIKRKYPTSYAQRGTIVNFFYGLMEGPNLYNGDGYSQRLEAAYRTLSAKPEVAMKLKPYQKEDV